MKINLSDYETGAVFDGDYENMLADLQRQLAEQVILHAAHKCRTLIIVEGWDAHGHLGAINALTAHWDPRYFCVFSVGAPTAEEKATHFLARFWNKLPHSSHIHVFDNSHYRRVLTDRVEGACSEIEWRRGYDEINEFESQQVDSGTKIVKIFLHTTPAKQDELLQHRLTTPSSAWAITADDFRMRDKCPEYMAAVNDMLDQTNTRWSPWTVIDGNDSASAQIAVLAHVLAAVKSFVPQQFPAVSAKIQTLAKKAFD